MATFKFKSEKNYLRVWKALNDTMINFSSYQGRCITVYDDKAATMLKKDLDDCGIAYEINVT